MFWLGALVSLCYIPGVTGAYIATQWPVLAVLMWCGLLRSGPFTLLHGAGLIFIAYATAHAWFSPVPQLGVFGLTLIWIMGLILWFGTTLTETRDLYAGLALGGAASSTVAVLQHFGVSVVPYVSSAPAGIYVNSVQQGTILALLVVALVSERMWIWALPLVPGLLLASSRGAWLMLVVGLLGCYVRRVWLLGIVAAAGAFYFLMPLSSSDQERMLIWTSAWHNLNWLGWGPGVFYTLLLPQNGGLLLPEYAHNDALQLVFEYGVAAALPLAIFAFALWHTEAKEWPVVLAFLAAGCYSMPLWMPLTSFVALVAVGRVLRAHSLVLSVSRYRRSYVLSRPRKAGRGVIPVAPHLATEG